MFKIFYTHLQYSNQIYGRNIYSQRHIVCVYHVLTCARRVCRFKLCSYFPYKNFGINKLLTAFNPMFPTFPLYVFTKDVFKIHRHVCHISLVLWMYFNIKKTIQHHIYVHTSNTYIPYLCNNFGTQQNVQDKKHSFSIHPKTYLCATLWILYMINKTITRV